LPERLSDVVNVLDWGANPAKGAPGSDTTAVQNAIDYAISKGGGKIFFPTGEYNVDGLSIGTANSADQDKTIHILGSGSGTLITAASGFVLSKGSRFYDLLERVEDIKIGASGTSPAGAVKLTRPRTTCQNVFVIGGSFGIDASLSDGAAIYGCGALGPGPYEPPAGDSNHGRATLGSIGIQVGNAGHITACRVQLYDIAIALSGTGVSCVGCATEVNNIGVRVGWANGVEVDTYGCLLSGLASERSMIPIELYNCQGGYISNSSLYVGDGYSGWETIVGGSWSRGIATINTLNPHNLISSPYVIALDIFNSTWYPNPAEHKVLVTSNGPNSFQYSLPSAPTPTTLPASPAPGRWKYGGEFALRCRKVYETVIANINRSDSYGKASFDLDYADLVGGSSGVDFRNTVFLSLQASCGWNLPTDRSKLAGCRFIGCSGVASGVTLFTANNVAVPSAKMNFADLPSGSGTQKRFEGLTYDIKDAATTSIGSAVTAGGSSNNYLVRYDGSSWIRIG
jgi:hypothetical protein